MKKLITLSVIAVFAASCASQKYSRTDNITDDVYFSPRDAEKTASTPPAAGDGFTYDQSPVTTNPNAAYRYYQGQTPDPDSLPATLNLPANSNYNSTTYNTYNNYYNTPGYSPYTMGMMYPMMGYSGWQIGMGFGYSPFFGYGYNPYGFYGTSCYYPSYGYGYYQPYGYGNYWNNPYCGNSYYNNGWNPWYSGWSGSATPVLTGPRVAFASPLSQTIIGPNGQRVRSVIPVPPTTRTVAPALSSSNPNLPPVQTRNNGPQPLQHNNTNDGERVVYPRQQYTAPAQPAKPVNPAVQRPVQRPQTPAPAQPAKPAEPQVQPPVQRQPVNRQPVYNNPPQHTQPPVYQPENNTPRQPVVQPRPDNNPPAVQPAPGPGRGSVNPNGGSGGSAPRRR